jgi:hypothetical protein
MGYVPLPGGVIEGKSEVSQTPEDDPPNLDERDAPSFDWSDG